MQDSTSESKKSSIFKKAFLYSIFIAEVVLLLFVVEGFIQREEYFSVSPYFALSLVLLLVSSLHTLAIISQNLHKKWEVLIPSTIIFISFFFFLYRYKITEALIGSALAFLFFSYSTYRTYLMKEDFIKIRIKYSSRHITKGFLLIISAITAFSVFLTSAHVSYLDLGQKVAEIAEEPLKSAVEEEYEKETPDTINSISLDSLERSNPQIGNILKSFGITQVPANISLPEESKEGVVTMLKNSISSQVNKVVDPYRRFFSPTLAILVFGIFQIYNGVAYFLYAQTIGLVLAVLKKMKFVEVEKIVAEKEILKI